MSEDCRVAVIGLGYVGLPLAISFVEAGLTVEGIDALPSRVAELNAGSSPIDDIDDARLQAALEQGTPRGRAGRRQDVGSGRDLRLCPDTDHDDQGSRPRAGPVGRGDDPRPHPCAASS